MRIIIAGAGEVGSHLAKMLSNENHDIVLIDLDEEKLRQIGSTCDLMTMHGSATSFELLKDSNIQKADLFIAVTELEDTNITAALIGKKMGAKRAIARIDNPEYMKFNFKEIIQGLEELVLADSGKDEFNEIFKLIFAKIWDEKQAQVLRKDKTVEFGPVINPKTSVPDPELTYDRTNGLFKKACEEWPGIFRDGEDIELMKRHLQICVGRIEGVRLMGSNLRIMDDAFEYLLPTEAKKKKGRPRVVCPF